MGRKTLIAVGDKKIEQFISSMKEVDVLSKVRKREHIIDKVIDLNPHILVMSAALAGKIEYREIIPRLRELRPRMKMVFLYGCRDEEFRFFASFLVENGVYNILEGEIDDYNLTEVIVNDYGLVDVQDYLLTEKEKFEEIFTENVYPNQQKTKPKPEIDNSAYIPPIEKELEVLFVEKIVERETIQTQVIGNIKVGIASLYNRAGCTHLAIELANFLVKLKKDVGVVVNAFTYNSLKSFYMVGGEDLVVNNVHIYSNPTLALNNHRCVIYDMGVINSDDEENTAYYEMNCKVLICPSSAWEIDTISSFLVNNTYAKKIDYVFYPITDKYFKEIDRNLKRNGCRAYKMQYNPDYFSKNADNFKIYQRITMGIINSF